MIISAACRMIVDDKECVFPVHRHSDFFRFIKQLHYECDKSKVEQGFLAWDPETRKETFLNRREAYKYARDCGQVTDKGMDAILFSEDLY